MNMQSLANGRYGSVADFVASLNSVRNTCNDKNYYDKGDRAEWLGGGCATLSDVKRCMRDGWPEGSRAVDDMLAKASAIETVPIDRRRRLTRCELGDSLDIHSVYRGELATAWTRAVRRATRGPQHVEILANMICQGGDDSSVLKWRGVAAIVLADKLEQSGFRVRIVVGFGGELSKSNERVSCRIVVKDHSNPLDVATCAAVTLPGFFRALGHQWAICHAAQQAYDGSMSVKQCIVESGEIILSHEARDESTARAWIEARIADINGQCAA